MSLAGYGFVKEVISGDTLGNIYLYFLWFSDCGSAKRMRATGT